MKLSVCLLACGLLAGCASSPSTTYYQLSARAASRPMQASTTRIEVGPVTLPAVLDRPQMVLNGSTTQLTILDQSRWAAPLSRMPRMPLALDAALSADLAGLRLKREQHRGPAVVYLSQPNCYTGELINRERLYDWIAAAGDATYFVLDEAYMEFVPDSRQHSLTEMLAGCTHKLLVLRTFSKAYGLAGLRVGYGLMSNGWLQHPTKLDSLCTLSVFGVRAALEAFEDKQWLMHSMRWRC